MQSEPFSRQVLAAKAREVLDALDLVSNQGAGNPTS